MLNKELADGKKQLHDNNDELKKKQLENLKLSQQTGIVKEDSLTNDYNARAKELKQLNADVKALKEKHTELL